MPSFRMGAGHQKDQTLIRILEVSSPFPNLQEVEGLKVDLIINDAYMIKPP